MFDCFARKGNGCKALSVKRCLGPSCPFYKTRAEAERSEAHARELLEALPCDERERIMDRYYKGRRRKLCR